MLSAQRRALALVAVASWLLIDAVRAAGPLLANLHESSPVLAISAAVLTALGGGLLAWAAAIASRHFGHGVTLLFMLVIFCLFRAAFPLASGGWLVATGLYVAAIALATVVLSARVGVGAGGGATVVAGTAFGGALAILEQTVLRTWDAVWRDDAPGWIAIIVASVAAIGAGLLCRRLEPAESSRGWWAYGLLWSLLIFTFANLGFVTAQAGVRTSEGLVFATAGLLLGAYLASQSTLVPRIGAVGIAVVGAGAVAAAVLYPGLGAGVALTVAFPALAYATALTLRAERASLARRLAAAFVFSLALLGPLLLGHLTVEFGWDRPSALVLGSVALPLLAVGAYRAWRPAAHGSAVAGTVVPVAAGLCITVVLSWWTSETYEQDRLYSAWFTPAPYVLSWNLNHGVMPGEFGGPGVRADEVAGTLADSSSDVLMLQEVHRGWLHGGGLDLVEFLAGELQMPYTYGATHDAHLGNVIFTARPHEPIATMELPAGEGLKPRGAVLVEYMGATYVATQLDPGPDAAADAHTRTLLTAVPSNGPVIMGADLGAGLDSPAYSALRGGGWVNAQEQLGHEGATTLVGTDGRADYLLGRGVEFTAFSVVPSGWSDHLPLTGRVVTGAEPLP